MKLFTKAIEQNYWPMVATAIRTMRQWLKSLTRWGRPHGYSLNLTETESATDYVELNISRLM